MTDRIFAEHAEAYRDSGYWPRPIAKGMKGSQLPNWQKPDPKWAETTLIGWQDKYAAAGIGLLLGSPLPDGTLLGALDIDHNDYVRVAGHSPAVTLGHYTQAVRGGAEALAMLDKAYQGE